MDPYKHDEAAPTEDFKIPSEWASKADSCGIKIYTFKEVREMGKSKMDDFKEKEPS